MSPEERAQLAREVASVVLANIRELVRPPAALLTKRALAAHLSVSVFHVDRLVKSGLPHVLVGSRPRFDLSACMAWLSKQRRLKRKSREDDGELLEGVTRLGTKRRRAANG
jgi:hypothetical protein